MVGNAPVDTLRLQVSAKLERKSHTKAPAPAVNCCSEKAVAHISEDQVIMSSCRNFRQRKDNINTSTFTLMLRIAPQNSLFLADCHDIRTLSNIFLPTDHLDPKIWENNAIFNKYKNIC